MTALPSAASFTGASVTEGGFKAAHDALISYLTGLLGTDGTVATALATLGANADRIGSVMWWPGVGTIPATALDCDGSAVSRTTYATLFGKLMKSATATMTIASPCIVTWTAHGLQNNMPVKFNTTGALPTGLIVGRTYWVVNKNTNDFQVALVPGGVAINTSGSQSGTHTAVASPHGDGDGSTTFNLPDMRGFMPMGAGASVATDSFNPADVNTGTSTITIPDNHAKWLDTQLVTFSTTGGAPTGLTNGNPYYVVRTGQNTIKLASSMGNAQNGTTITISGQGTGVHTITAVRTTRGVGEHGGQDIHGMTLTELLSHTHGINVYQTTGVSGGGSEAARIPTGSTTSARGGNIESNMLPPFKAGRFIIYFA